MGNNKQETGAKGERLAAMWLEANGFTIVERNWRHGRYEIDLLAHRDGILHVVEVKTRTNAHFGYPEENVSPKKFNHIMLGAEQYLEEHPEWTRVQYDVLSIILGSRNNPEFFFAEDVYL